MTKHDSLLSVEANGSICGRHLSRGEAFVVKIVVVCQIADGVFR